MELLRIGQHEQKLAARRVGRQQSGEAMLQLAQRNAHHEQSTSIKAENELS